MPIYLLRHGESVANVRRVMAGQKDDCALTDLGMQQARQAGEELVSTGITRIVSSPLKRALSTAEEIADVIGFDPDMIEIDDRIQEYDMGALTGTPVRVVSSLELTTADDSEDALAFRDRVLSFLRENKDSSETILMVSHGGVGRSIEAAKRGIDAHEFYGMPHSPNAHPIKLDLDWL